MLWDADTGRYSAVVDQPDSDGVHDVTYRGENLWRGVAAAYRLWLDTEQPGWDRFGMTVTPNHQSVWLDDPDGPYVWPLRTS